MCLIQSAEPAVPDRNHVPSRRRERMNSLTDLRLVDV